MSVLRSSFPSLCGFFVIVIVWNITLHPVLQENMHQHSWMHHAESHLHHAFLMVLSVTFVLLSHIKTYKADYLSGRLTFITSNYVSITRYCINKFLRDWCGYVMPLTLLSWGLEIMTTSHASLFFLISMFCMLTLALLFSHLLSTLSLTQSHTPLFNFVLIWPFLIPPLLLCLTLSQTSSALMYVPLTEGFILLSAILCLSISLCFFFSVKNIIFYSLR